MVWLGPPAWCPVSPLFLVGRVIDYRKTVCTLLLTSLLEDLEFLDQPFLKGQKGTLGIEYKDSP